MSNSVSRTSKNLWDLHEFVDGSPTSMVFGTMVRYVSSKSLLCPRSRKVTTKCPSKTFCLTGSGRTLPTCPPVARRTTQEKGRSRSFTERSFSGSISDTPVLGPVRLCLPGRRPRRVVSPAEGVVGPKMWGVEPRDRCIESSPTSVARLIR